jgi:hypothetical protein
MLKVIDNQMEVAVSQCIEAACNEIDVNSQKLLLEAATFGKTFADGIDSECVVNACRVLRVLNMARQRTFALPLSYAQ